jgi:protein TonB
VIAELAAPPPAPAVRVGGDIRPPVKVKDAAPVYPEIARAARVQGIVILEATIDASGRVSATRLLRSVPLLDEAALAAVRQWVFTPTRLNGEPTAVIMTVTVQFNLD